MYPGEIRSDMFRLLNVYIRILSCTDFITLDLGREEKSRKKAESTWLVYCFFLASYLRFLFEGGNSEMRLNNEVWILQNVYPGMMAISQDRVQISELNRRVFRRSENGEREIMSEQQVTAW
jgi:hypothetical protein